MSWYDFIDIGTPLVFSPKVTPDPTAAEHLEEKFQHAIRQLYPNKPHSNQPHSNQQIKRLRTPTAPPNSLEGAR